MKTQTNTHCDLECFSLPFSRCKCWWFCFRNLQKKNYGSTTFILLWQIHPLMDTCLGKKSRTKQVLFNFPEHSMKVRFKHFPSGLCQHNNTKQTDIFAHQCKIKVKVLIKKEKKRKLLLAYISVYAEDILPCKL